MWKYQTVQQSLSYLKTKQIHVHDMEFPMTSMKIFFFANDGTDADTHMTHLQNGSQLST